MRKFLPALLFLFFSAISLYQPAFVWAQGTFDLGFITLSTDPATLASQILDFGIGLGILFAIIFLILGGYEVAASSGDPERLEVAKARITAAVSGLVFLLASALILRTIGCDLIGLNQVQGSIICQ